MSHAIAMIFLREESPESSLAFLLERWSKQAPHPDCTGLEASENGLKLEWTGCTLDFLPIPHPIPSTEWTGLCESSWMWPDAGQEIEQHGSHLIVAASGQESLVGLHLALSLGTALVLEALKGSLGVYWGNSSSLVRKDFFAEYTEGISSEDLPIPIWINTPLMANENGTLSGFTIGLKAFGMMEVETLDAREAPEDLRNKLWNLSDYLLRKGPVIQDGDTFGLSAEDMVLVKHSPSSFGGAGTVLQLIHDRKT